jgi:hypothetical protein
MLNADPSYYLRLFGDDLDESIDESGSEEEFTRRKNETIASDFPVLRGQPASFLWQ